MTDKSANNDAKDDEEIELTDSIIENYF